MSGFRTNGKRDWDASAPPGWLRDGLGVAALSPEFRQRCLQAAAAGRTIAALRRERMQSERGWSDSMQLSFGAYMEGLASLARVPLQGLLAWLGVEALDPAVPGFGRAAGVLGRRLDMTVSEAVARGLASLVQKFGFSESELEPIFGRTGGRPTGDPVSREAALEQIRKSLSSEQQAEWARLEKEIRAAFR